MYRRYSIKQQVEVRPESLLVLATRDEVLQFCDRFVEYEDFPKSLADEFENITKLMGISKLV
jgi:hypothetical protein